ncbi:MAG: tRNA (adenosine(37)-N6)-threonylcarbamoyltransferase complex dimerization subunit type 1 TsaB [Planctomycetota bacterium]
MRILAIDTSIGSGSAAAVDDGGCVERPLGPAGSHARLLTATLEGLVTERRWASGAAPLRCLGPADVIAVVRGPGSFTGLRVGVTTAKALAWATGAKLVGVSGFEVIARRTTRLAGRGDVELEIAYDAGRGEVFVAAATPAGAGWHVGDPLLLPADDWLASLPPGRWISGPALDQFTDRVARRADLVVAPAEARHPAAGDATAIARIRAEAGMVDEPHGLVPDYLRPSYAEERNVGRGP